MIGGGWSDIVIVAIAGPKKQKMALIEPHMELLVRGDKLQRVVRMSITACLVLFGA